MKTQLLELTAMFIAGYCIGRYIESKQQSSNNNLNSPINHSEVVKRYRQEKIREGLKSIAFGIIGGNCK